MTTFDIDKFRYDAMIGVGGIGSGSFFKLNRNHTLGREESRGGTFLDQKDYCKLHIISHYVKSILGLSFNVIPIGKVGDDDVGERLIREMEETGFSMEFIEKSEAAQTLFSFCFIYPDGSGGNVTTSDSASSKVDPDYVSSAEPLFVKYQKKGIALAVPEVSLEARKKLIELATTYHFYRIGSFTSEEMPFVIQSDFIQKLDLLAINLDEAASLTGKKIESDPPDKIIDEAVRICSEVNSKLNVSITNGKDGSWSWDGKTVVHTPSIDVEVVNTAGAGDAHLSGLVVGLTLGISLHEAQKIASVTGGLSVTSPHTINKDVNRNKLKDFANKTKIISTDIF